MADFAQEIGAYSVVCPGVQMNSKEGWTTVAKELNEYGKIMHEKGIVFGYHNHAHEFETFDGVCALDLLFEHSDPRYVTCQFDTYWVLKGGKVPQEYIAKYQGRCPTIHVKDISKAALRIRKWEREKLILRRYLKQREMCSGLF